MDKQRMLFKRIKCLLAIKGTSIKNLSERMACSAQTYYDYANGRRALPSSMKEAIAEEISDPDLWQDEYKLDLSLDTLLEQEIAKEHLMEQNENHLG